MACSRTGWRLSSSAATRSSTRNWATSSGSISIRPSVRWCCAWTKSRRVRRHRHIEFVAFLNSLARRYPGRELHLICDNYGTPKHPAVKQWSGRAFAYPSPLHPDQRLVAQPGRALVRAEHRPGDSPRQLPERVPARACHHALARSLECAGAALPLDQVRRSDQTQHPQRCTYLRDGTLGAPIRV
jgi:hypothetical protein